ncbi:hypothetical protein QFZ82_001425 [Streptomyces sp. V4I23]|nr:hypothetical protein [Streptomyces sp. V4I23]
MLDRHLHHLRLTPAPQQNQTENLTKHGEPHDHAIGRSRGGLTTKIHLASDGNCRPWPSSSPLDRLEMHLPSRR